jgi:hypothetical protein
LSLKVAYLIAAHANPRHFGRLVRTLTSSDAGCFVHVDAKAPIDPFRREVDERVVFCSERHRVYWGEFSQVQATLVMLTEALRDARRFDYFVLLSGADYPLGPPEQINAFLMANQGCEFINTVPMPSAKASKGLERLTRYKVRSGQLLTWPEKALRRLIRRTRILARERDIDHGLEGLAPYAGSSWWALTRESCEHLVAFIRERPRFVRFFENAWYPDEAFFQTIVANSPKRSAIRHNLTFTDWGAGGAHPAKISEAHMELFRRPRILVRDGVYGDGEVFFARKFDDASGPLLDPLDEAIAWKREILAPPP